MYEKSNEANLENIEVLITPSLSLITPHYRHKQVINTIFVVYLALINLWSP